MPIALAIARACWMIWLLLWMVFALRTKPAQRSESVASRLRYSVLATAGFVLIFWQRLVPPPLRDHWLPASSSIDVLGLTLTVAGLGLTFWARVHLGANWSGQVTVKVDHSLIRTGPYARVRHPIYSGILLAAVGTALLHRETGDLLGLILIFAAFWTKLRTEERFMSETFGAQYESYAHHTGALLPRLR